MRYALESVGALAGAPFDDVIDVRSPSEFAEDHLPGAISLPVLSDAERARVGTIYVRDDRFRARRIGAALVARNAAAHIEERLADRGGGWRPLVYCWRGGQRSGAFAVILDQIGWRVGQLEGGYRSWRRLVSELLYQGALPHRLVVLDGNTGTAKTDILHAVARRGGQVLDLEGLAAHRGSVLGAVAGGQPSQKAFETRLASAVAALDRSRPTLVEAESSRIGERMVPPRGLEGDAGRAADRGRRGARGAGRPTSPGPTPTSWPSRARSPRGCARSCRCGAGLASRRGAPWPLRASTRRWPAR